MEADVWRSGPAEPEPVRWLPEWPPPREPGAMVDGPVWKLATETEDATGRYLAYLENDIMLVVKPVGSGWVVADEWDDCLAVAETLGGAVDAVYRLAERLREHKEPN